MSETPVLTVYFDGSCPLCQREIALYRRLPESSRLAWVDVSGGLPPEQLGAGLNCQAAMARFHVRNAQGALFSGAAAFSLMWRQFPGWRWLGWLSAWPPMSWLFEGAYRAFLPLRPWMQRRARRLLNDPS